MAYVKVKDNEGLVKDTKTSAILNVDGDGLTEYKKRREMMRKKENEIEQLKNDVSEIKSLLLQILDKEGNK